MKWMMKMSFLFINTQELSALMGLPHIQQSAYLLGIRPYMDRKTFIVGIKRRISYQSLSEALYIEPHQGFKSSGSPSRPQLRRVISGLERAGIVAIQSSDKNLILKCLLANADNSIQNKPVTNPAPQPDTNQSSKKDYKSTNYSNKTQKPDIGQTAKPGTPHNSEDLYVCVYTQFEKFWEIYPNKIGKQGAFEEFKKLQPSDALLTEIRIAINKQTNATDLLQSQGHWIPKWKFPANWLMQHCWKDEILMPQSMETKHEANTRHYAEKPSIDSFWDACKAGAKTPSGNHVIRGKA